MQLKYITVVSVLLIATVRAPAQVSGQGGIITTVAGIGSGGFSGDGGPATSAQLTPWGVAADASGNLFIADEGNQRIRKVSTNGIITTVAGGGEPGGGDEFPFPGDGGPATSAFLDEPNGVAVDASGNLFIADSGNQRIRKVSTNGIITTVAGSGLEFPGDGGPGTSAYLNFPTSVAVDATGNVFFTDDNLIRKVSTNGIITTVFSVSSHAQGVAVNTSGNLFFADTNSCRIWEVFTGGVITPIAGDGDCGFSGDGGRATSAWLYLPTGVAVDASGNLFIADEGNQRIRKVSTNGIITTVAGGGYAGFSGDGGPATSANVNDPLGVAVDASGNIFVADTGSNRIRKVSAPSSTTLPPPSVKSGGVVPVYSTVTTIQPGEWVSIYGTNLASSTATWNRNFPTSLGGTSVTVNGKSAYLWSVGPTQINMQAPNDTTTGPVPVVVTTVSGTFSSTVTLAQFAPSFSLLDSKHVTGIILRSNGSGAYGGGTYDILGPTGNSLGYATVAAKAGDTVELFAVGLGPTNPTVLAGQVFSGSAPTTNSVNLLINNLNVIPTFAGLSSAGLYQINLTMPSGLGTRDVSLVATVGGVRTPSGVVISLQ